MEPLLHMSMEDLLAIGCCDCGVLFINHQDIPKPGPLRSWKALKPVPQSMGFDDRSGDPVLPRENPMAGPRLSKGLSDRSWPPERLKYHPSRVGAS